MKGTQLLILAADSRITSSGTKRQNMITFVHGREFASIAQVNLQRKHKRIRSRIPTSKPHLSVILPPATFKYLRVKIPGDFQRNRGQGFGRTINAVNAVKSNNVLHELETAEPVLQRLPPISATQTNEDLNVLGDLELLLAVRILELFDLSRCVLY